MCFSKELNKETKKVSTKTMDYQKNPKFTWKEKYALYKKNMECAGFEIQCKSVSLTCAGTHQNHSTRVFSDSHKVL